MANVHSVCGTSLNQGSESVVRFTIGEPLISINGLGSVYPTSLNRFPSPAIKTITFIVLTPHSKVLRRSDIEQPAVAYFHSV